ncbi:MAG: hypothetical protein LBT88_00030 [Oscillospiraceae bacterium]|jgi:hypothetical protein|nr:hypothetical protein [Oscillospiraceae bacterium]
MKTRKSTRLLALIMAVILCFSLLPSMAAASTPGDITVYIDFEGYNLGQGLYIAPTKNDGSG